MARCCPQKMLLLIFMTAASGLMTTTGQMALREWVRSCSVGLDDSFKIDEGRVVAAKARARGERVFALTDDAPLSAAEAYRDRDVGGPLRSLAQSAGPGFDVVALSGVLAVERVRSYRTVKQKGQEFSGDLMASRYGAFARSVWDDYERREVDEEMIPLVEQAVSLLVPILDTAARRSFTVSLKADSSPAFLSEEWARQAMFEDGDSAAWTRAEIETLAYDALALVLDQQRPPPPYLNHEGAPDRWPRDQRLAVLPIVNGLIVKEAETPNCVLGAPTPQNAGNLGQGECIWCIADADIKIGDPITISDPYA